MRRLLPWLVVLALPLASAAGFSLPVGRVAEAVAQPGGDAVFVVPLEAEQDGLVYAKVLPTEGNAVDDGAGPNGSVAAGTGWRVTFALVREDGAVDDMGTFADGGMSRLAPIRAGERLALRATVHTPADALKGGAEQRVYVALAYRDAPQGADPGSTSGGQMDAARALTLLVRLSDTAVSLPPGGGAGGGSGTDPGGVPPVGPIPPAESGTRVVVVQQAPLPTWFMAGLLGLLGALVLVGAVAAYALLGLLRERKRHATPTRVPVQAAEPVKQPEGTPRRP